MKPLAIIPARAGSKRLPGKNLVEFHGSPLISWAIEQAFMLFEDRIAVTSDIEAVISPGLAGPRYHAFFRGPELAADDTPMMPVVRDCVDRMRRFVTADFDVVVLLQPTSPLRSQADILAALELLDRGNDAVVSVVETAEPEVYTLGHAGRMRRIGPVNDGDTYGRKLVVPNGAVFAIKLAVLDAGYDWWTAPVVAGYEMPAERSIDIDTPADLERARELWNRQQSSIASSRPSGE